MSDLITEAEARKAERWLNQREFKGLRSFSNPIAAFIDKTFGWITPNLITLLLGILLCAPAMALHYAEFNVAYIVVLTIAFGSDFLDGAYARFLKKRYNLVERSLEDEEKLSLWRRINTKGPTHLGIALDPFADKVRYFSVIFTIGYGYVESWLIWSSLVVAITLTLIRPIMRKLKLGTGASSKLGKIKIFIEVSALIAIYFIPQEYAGVLISNTLVGIALLGGVASLSGHLFLFVRRFKRPPRSRR